MKKSARGRAEKEVEGKRVKERKRQRIGEGKEWDDEVTPVFFFQSRRVIQARTHKQYTVKKKRKSRTIEKSSIFSSYSSVGLVRSAAELKRTRRGRYTRERERGLAKGEIVKESTRRLLRDGIIAF